jgi:hypothetical protein
LLNSLIGSGASSALNAVRADIAQAEEDERRVAAAEAARRVQETSLLAAAASSAKGAQGGSGLGAVREEDEDEEDEASAESTAAAEPAAVAASTGTAAPATDDTPAEGMDAEEAVIAAEFEATTRVMQAKLQAPGAAGTAGRPIVSPFGLTGASKAAEPPALPPRPAALARFKAVAVELLQDERLRPLYASIVADAPDPQLGCFGRLFATKLLSELKQQKADVFALAKTKFDPQDSTHDSIFASLYKGFTGADFAGSQSSWQAIGFQRDSDFSTDLRDAGMLGPVLALFLLQGFPGFARKAFLVSQSDTQGFPLMVHSIVLTAKAMYALRIGRLNKLCNAFAKGTMTVSTIASGAAVALPSNPVFEAFAAFYSALFFKWYTIWISRGATIVQIGSTINEALQYAFDDPVFAVYDFLGAMSLSAFQMQAVAAPVVVAKAPAPAQRKGSPTKKISFSSSAGLRPSTAQGSAGQSGNRASHSAAPAGSSFGSLAVLAPKQFADIGQLDL